MMLEIAKVVAILIVGPCLAATLMLWTLEFFMRLQRPKGLGELEAFRLANEGTSVQVHTNSPEKQITISFDFDGKHMELKGITHLRVAQGSFAERQDSMLTPETSSVG